MGEMRNGNKLLARKYKGKRLFARPRRRWENNININISELGLGYALVNLAYGRDR
jgi:hypothetical protein